MKNLSTSCLVIAAILLCVMGCRKFGMHGKINLLEGDNAARGAAKIKQTIGAETLNVIRAEIRPHTIEITVQAPNNPKNLDVYTYTYNDGDYDGTVSGPAPVKVVTTGNTEMTADKYNATNIDEIDFLAIPATVKKAIELSQLENGDVDLIWMVQESAERTNPKIKEDRQREIDAVSKEVSDKQKQCDKDVAKTAQCMEEVGELLKKQMSLTFDHGKTIRVLTWRIFVEGPRGRKDFWADKKGNINETPF